MQKPKSLFELTLDRLLTIEGGYTDDPNDAGGATNRGVTQDTYDDWQREYHNTYKLIRNSKGKLIYRSVRYIKRDEAAQIYKEKFWDKVHADELPPDIAVVVFDTAANSHPAEALDLLRQALQMPSGSSWNAVIAKLKGVQSQGKTQQLVDHYLNARWHYVDVHLPAIRPKDLHFQRGWYERYGQVRDLSLAVNQYRMKGTPKNSPLVLGNPGDYVPLQAEHGEFTIYGDKVLKIPGKNGTYVMLDARSHYPLMDDKGNVIVFDSRADALKSVSSGAFVGTLNEPGTKPAQPKTGLPTPGVVHPGMPLPHPGRPNQPPAVSPAPHSPALTPGPSPAGGRGEFKATSFPHSAAGEFGTDQAAGFVQDPEQHYAAVPQGFGRWSMLHRQTHQYLPDPWGNRLYFSSPQEGFREAAARMNPAPARMPLTPVPSPSGWRGEPTAPQAAGAFAPSRTQQVAGVPAAQAPAVPGGYLTPHPPSLQVGGVPGPGSYPAGAPAVHPVVAALARAVMMAQAYPPAANPAMPAVPGALFAAGQTTG